MTETPSQSLVQNGHIAQSESRPWWKYSQRRIQEAVKTPRTHRLFASAGPKTPHGKQATYNYEGLLNRTWRAHALSPLFMFKSTPVSLKRYGRSLDIAYSKTTVMTGSDDQSTQSSFEVYHGLRFHTEDPDAIRIQVTEKHDGFEKIVLTAVLMRVDMEDPGLMDRDVSDSFTFYPLVLVCGTKQRAEVLLDWLQRHFDCRSSPMEFSDSDLRWMLAMGCRHDGAKANHPILVQYDVSEICDGINVIDCKFEAAFCKQLCDKLSESNTSDTEEFLTESQVCQFVSSLESHLEYSMHIIFAKLSLKEVGTPLYYVSRDGKIKLQDSRGVYGVLHMMCEVVTQRMLQGYALFG